MTSYGKGYASRVSLSSRSRRMRPKSVEEFKDKIRELPAVSNSRRLAD